MGHGESCWLKFSNLFHTLQLIHAGWAAPEAMMASKSEGQPIGFLSGDHFSKALTSRRCIVYTSIYSSFYTLT